MPCRSIGGDFFDYVDLPDGGFGFAVGDVAGKGAPAALLTAVHPGRVLGAGVDSGSSPAETLSRVNQALIRRAIESRFATAFYAVVAPGRPARPIATPATTRRWSSRRTGVTRLEKGGLILGLFEHATFEEETIALEPGDLLVVFSDGVTEALSATRRGVRRGSPAGLRRSEPRRSPPQDVLDAIFASVREFTAGAVQSDDVTALVLRYDGQSLSTTPHHHRRRQPLAGSCLPGLERLFRLRRPHGAIPLPGGAIGVPPRQGAAGGDGGRDGAGHRPVGVVGHPRMRALCRCWNCRRIGGFAETYLTGRAGPLLRPN